MTQDELREFVDAVAEVDMWLQEVEPELGLA